MHSVSVLFGSCLFPLCPKSLIRCFGWWDVTGNMKRLSMVQFRYKALFKKNERIFIKLVFFSLLYQY